VEGGVFMIVVADPRYRREIYHDHESFKFSVDLLRLVLLTGAVVQHNDGSALRRSPTGARGLLSRTA
jgi:hypothetical protein